MTNFWDKDAIALADEIYKAFDKSMYNDLSQEYYKDYLEEERVFWIDINRHLKATVAFSREEKFDVAKIEISVAQQKLRQINRGSNVRFIKIVRGHVDASKSYLYFKLNCLTKSRFILSTAIENLESALSQKNNFPLRLYLLVLLANWNRVDARINSKDKPSQHVEDILQNLQSDYKESSSILSSYLILTTGIEINATLKKIYNCN